MTPLAIIALCGPIIGFALGLAIGFGGGKASNADEVGALRERSEALEEQCNALSLRLQALAASPPSRRESARVLDRIAPRSIA